MRREKSSRRQGYNRAVLFGTLIIVSLGASPVMSVVWAQEPNRPLDPVSELVRQLQVEQYATPKQIYAAFESLKIEHSYQNIVDPNVRELMIQKAGAEFAVNIVANALIDVVADKINIPKLGAFNDKYVFRELLITMKNVALLPVEGTGALFDQVIQSVFTISDSWNETSKVLDSLPPKESLSPEEQAYLKGVYALRDARDKLRKVGASIKDTIRKIGASIKNTLISTAFAPTAGSEQNYSEPNNQSIADRPKVIDTVTNYISGSAVFSPSSGLAYLGTATGFGFRGEMPDTLESYDLGSTGSGRRGSASIADQGADASGGNLNWGRWSGAGSTNVAGGITYTGQNFHYIFGSAPTNIPTSGSVTYNPVGGTNPTSSGGTNVAAGTAGTFNGGTIGVNFATRGVTISNLNFTVSTATFNMNGSSTYNSNALFSGSLTGTCTGAACSGAVSGNHAGTLTGPAAAGIGLSYQAHTTGTGMVVGAQGFKR